MNLKHIIFVTAALVCSATLATDTTFTYQGRLDQGGQPHTGSPAMRFLLFTSETGGSFLGEVNKGSVTVNDGLFQVDLDFGNVFDGSPRWLEVRVDGVAMVPRQAIRAVPMAMFAQAGNERGSGMNMSAPGPGAEITSIFSWGVSAPPDDLDATHDTEGRVVIAVRGGTSLRTVRCNNPDCVFGPASPSRNLATSPVAAGSEAPLEILLGPDDLIYVLYGGTGNNLVLVRCVTIACGALETVLQLTLTQSVRDVSLAVQNSGRLALMAVLNDGSSLIYRCDPAGCASGSTSALTSAGDAVRVSATTIGSMVNESLAIATLHGDGILRLTMCGNASCNERSSLSGVNANGAIRAITGIDSRPLIGYFKGNSLSIARCLLSNCFNLAETTMSGSSSGQQLNFLSGTVLGNGLPVFVLSNAFHQVLICSDIHCAEPAFYINPGRPFFRMPAASVGPDGALRIVRHLTEGVPNFVQVLRCRDEVNCASFHRPR